MAYIGAWLYGVMAVTWLLGWAYEVMSHKGHLMMNTFLVWSCSIRTFHGLTAMLLLLFTFLLNLVAHEYGVF